MIKHYQGVIMLAIHYAKLAYLSDKDANAIACYIRHSRWAQRWFNVSAKSIIDGNGENIGALRLGKYHYRKQMLLQKYLDSRVTELLR